MIDNFVKIVLENGGAITPLLIPSENTNGTSLFNSSKQRYINFSSQIFIIF